MKRRISLGQRAVALLLTVLFLLSASIPASAQSTVTISKNSITIQVGETYQLQVLENGKAANGAAWKSSNVSVATVSEKGIVTAKGAGSAVITATAEGITVECLVSVVAKSASATIRYNVLILDTSGSMSGKPLKREKEAAKRFCKTILNSDGSNYLAVITMNSSSNVLCGFTNDSSKLNKCISSVKSSGGSNMNAALQRAGKLMEKIKSGSNVMKNIILCSDGLPKTGSVQVSGRYKAADHSYYKYANAAYKTDVSLKNKNYFIYALGFFHNSDSKDLKFGKKLMKDLASKNKYYVVMNSKDIDNVFKNVANRITKTTITKKSLTLYVGETYKLGVQVNGITKKASWKSSKLAVASVDSSGKVTAKKSGKTTVTGTFNGKSVSCKVTVKKKKAAAKPKNPTIRKSIRLNRSAATVYLRKTLQLKATVSGPSKKVKWKSSNPKIATVNRNGKVTGKKTGTVRIAATANGIKAVCVVKVEIKHPTYSQYFMVDSQKSSYGDEKINEYGVRLVVNKGAVIKKCAVYLEKNGNSYKRTIACVGRNITYAYYVPYLARNGKIIYDGMAISKINVFSLSQGAYKVWSRNGNYGLITADLTDVYGNQLAIKSRGVSGKNTKIFYDLNKMIKWLQK